MTDNMITVEVAYALPDKQKIISLQVQEGCSAREAVALSRINIDFPEIDLASAPLGIFGNTLGARGLPAAEDYALKSGDRVEIYRPLIVDPKEVRRQRAAEAQLRKEAAASDSPDSDNQVAAD